MDFRPVEYRGMVMTEEEIMNLFYFKFRDAPLLRGWMQLEIILLMNTRHYLDVIFLMKSS